MLAVGFKITGEWLADFARTRLLEGAWDHALSLLQDSLEGITLDQSVSILKGETTLIGDSRTGIDIVPFDKEDENYQNYMSDVDYLYGTIFKIGDQHWKPYAQVTGPWDIDDMRFAANHFHVISKNIVGSGLGDKTRMGGRKVHEHVARSMYYARDYKEDMLVVFEIGFNDYEILCEKVDKPPFWFKCGTISAEHFLRNLVQNSESLILDGVGSIKDCTAGVGQATYDRSDPEEVLINNDKDHVIHTIGSDFLESVTSQSDLDVLSKIEIKYDNLIEKHQKFIPSEQWTLIEDAWTILYNKKLELYQTAITTQAQTLGGFIRLELNHNIPTMPNFVEVPKHPFILWALRGFSFKSYGIERPVWENVTPKGFKMAQDDPNHSDFLIGAGCNPKHAYDSDEATEHYTPNLTAFVMSAAYSKRTDIIKEWTGVEFAYLSKSSDDDLYYWGKVVHANPDYPIDNDCIPICKNAGMEYQFVLEAAKKGKKIIICETGGKLAHLATVGREYNVNVLLVPDALTKYKQGQFISIDLVNNNITLTLL